MAISEANDVLATDQLQAGFSVNGDIVFSHKMREESYTFSVLAKDNDVFLKTVERLNSHLGNRVVIIHTFGFKSIARFLADHIPGSIILEMGEISRFIVESERKSSNLGNQLAAETFAEILQFQKISIIMVGFEDISLSDRKGSDTKLTKRFLLSFLDSMNCQTNGNLVIFLISHSKRDTVELLSGISDYTLLADKVEDKIDVQVVDNR
ncbi:MAG: hypothetical protein M0T81_01760 [Thermoplasmatales archaeon]|nr:hypothetical protein [Thermoplasmatales archaeon]